MFRGLEGAEEGPGGVFQVYLGADADEDEMARAHVDLYRGFDSPRGISLSDFWGGDCLAFDRWLCLNCCWGLLSVSRVPG